MKILCVICQKEFSKIGKAKTCSKDCSDIYRSMFMQSEYRKEYEKQRKQSPKYKLYLKNRNQSPEYKKLQKERRKRVEYKESQKKYSKTEKFTIVQKRYSQTPTGRMQKIESVHKRRALKLKSSIGKIDYEFIKIRDGGRCQICGKKINFELKHPHPKSLNYDHILPLSKNGSHTTNNLQLSHYTCNLHKQAFIHNGIQQNLF